MPIKDKAARAAYHLAYHHKRKLIDPEWLKKRALRTKAWRKKNPEKAKKQAIKLLKSGYFKEWRIKNKDKRAQYTRDCKKRHPERYRIRSRRWYRDNPEKAKAQKERTYHRTYEKFLYRNSIRRARKSGAKGSHTLQQWLWRVQFFGWRCFYCKAKLTNRTLTKDHQIALAVGGTDFASNLVPACLSCNCSKAHRKAPTISA